MRSSRIKAELEERGTCLSNIAREVGAATQVVSYVANRKTKSRKIETAIAKALDKPLHIVFPDRYQLPVGYVPPATIEVSAKELAQIKTSLAEATRTIELLGA